MSTIAVECPVCHKQYNVDEKALGKSAKCACGNEFSIAIATDPLIESQPPSVQECPFCQQSVAGLASVCEACGYDFVQKRAPRHKARSQSRDRKPSSILATAEGVNGQIDLYSNKVCIRRKGVLGFLTQGLKGDKNLMISAITSIQFKKAGTLTSGYIQFAFMGGQEAKGGLFQAGVDENTVMFNTSQQAAFEKIRDEVEQRIQAGNAPTTTSSDADELAKLAELRDKGILTEEEFQQKKKQVLGL